ncbi:AarF domain-containing protein kinase [Pycnococcus provasolii]
MLTRTARATAGKRAHGAQRRARRRHAAPLRAVEEKTSDSPLRLDAPGIGSPLNVGVDAIVELSSAVRQKGVEAPDEDGSKVAIKSERKTVFDEDGLPMSYDRESIQKYWNQRPGELQSRWTTFLRSSVPFLTRVAGMLVTGGGDELKRNSGSLAKQARESMEELGPTYIKVGQMLSVRPDVLPAEAMDELAKLQDGVPQFDSSVAFATIESELGAPVNEIFEEISPEPIAAASLAQVYKARVRPSVLGRGDDEEPVTVAVKVQRPSVKALASKDLYVLRRASEIYQGLMDRYIAPNQRTDYVALFNEWAVGFYTELDFLNEMDNQLRMRGLFEERGMLGGENGVYIPKVYESLCSSRVLVTEFVDGKKLSQCEPAEIKVLTKVGQEVFLTQLLDFAFVHGDPHPGNLLALDPIQSDGRPAPARLALLDFGLMTELTEEDTDTIVNAIVHTANRSYGQLVDDFIRLKILPPDTDRAVVQPLMDKAITPYVRGGGAQNYKDEIEKIYGTGTSGFQALTSDVVTVMGDVPFSIPPYFALLARAVVTLEGTALQGDPNYQLVMEAYPFVARRLLSGDRPALQTALEDILYARGSGGDDQLRLSRLSTLLISALSPEELATADSGAFIDLDAAGDAQNLALRDVVRLFLSPSGRNLRSVLVPEVATAADVLLRRGIRRLAQVAQTTATIPRPPVPFLPWPAPGAISDALGSVPLPVPIPLANGQLTYAMRSAGDVVDVLAPELSNEELAYASTLSEASGGKFLDGDDLPPPSAVLRVFHTALTTGVVELPNGAPASSGDILTALSAAERAASAAETTAISTLGRENVPWTPFEADAEEDIVGAIGALSEEESAEFRTFVLEVISIVWEKSAKRAEEARLATTT